MQNRRRVVITGIGVVSPNGVGADAFADACIAGVSGIHAVPRFDIPLKSRAVASVVDFDPSTVMDAVDLRRVPRMVPLALAAAREAMTGAALEIDPDDLDQQRKIGIALGTGGGGLAFVEEQYRQLFQEGTPSLFSITAGTHGNLSSELSIKLHLRGPSHVLSTGCTSSTDAIGYAMMLIRAGVLPMMLVGGADSPIAPGILNAFEKMRIVSVRPWDVPSQASRPFDAKRDGFVLGEGSWMFVIEDAEHAERRGANAMAELCGYASTCDAYHRVQIAPQLLEPVRAMEMAMADGGIEKREIGYVNFHGTSTDLNDRMETAAVRKCFGTLADGLAGSSTKSMIGHPQGACGAAGVAATVLSLRRGLMHPTINLENPDPACDLNYIANVAKPTETRTALCNCIAFGSKNSALVVRV